MLLHVVVYLCALAQLLTPPRPSRRTDGRWDGFTAPLSMLLKHSKLLAVLFHIRGIPSSDSTVS